jgi:hypothetical protein
MEIGDNGHHILAAQQLVEEDYRSDRVSVTILYLELVANLV